MNRIVTLRRKHGLRKIGNWVPLRVLLLELRKDPSYYPIRGISLHTCGFSRTVVYQNWGCEQSILELLEGFLIWLVKLQGGILLCKAVHGTCNATIVLDKPSIEITETQERLDTSYGGWPFPVPNNRDLLRVDLDPISTNDEA
jgi:hypothetical protein